MSLNSANLFTVILSPYLLHAGHRRRRLDQYSIRFNKIYRTPLFLVEFICFTTKVFRSTANFLYTIYYLDVLFARYLSVSNSQTKRSITSCLVSMPSFKVCYFLTIPDSLLDCFTSILSRRFYKRSSSLLTSDQNRNSFQFLCAVPNQHHT